MKKADILVVEDERVVAEDIQRSLTNIGYSVIGIVSSGADALKCVEEKHPDLVLMDIVLRGPMNGIETAEEIRDRYNLPVVYLTAYADESTLERAKQTEPFGYILKPFNDRELYSTIEMALYKHRMDRRLRESEVWFSTTLKSIGDGVIATDKEGLVTFMNAVAESLTGWQMGEAEGLQLQEVFNIISEKTRLPIESPVEKVLRSGKISDITEHSILISRDKREFPIDDSVAPIKDDLGNIIGVVLIFKDITERKRSEEQLQSERDFSNTLVQASPAFYVAVDTQGKTMMMNDAMLKALRMEWEEVKDTEYVSNYVLASDRDTVKNLIEKAIKHKESTTSENHVLTKDGRVLLVEWHARPVVKQGKVEFVFSMGIDITERKQAEDALRMSEELYRGLFETMAQGVVYYDHEKKIIVCNPAAEAILGKDKEQLVGMDVFDSFWTFVLEEGTQLPENEHPVIQCLKTGSPVTDVVLGIVAENLRKWVLVNATPVSQHNEATPQTVFTTYTDITQRKKFEFALQKRNIQLNSLNALTRAVSGTLDLSDILEKALEEVTNLAEFSAAGLYLYNEDFQSLSLKVENRLTPQINEILSTLHVDEASPYRKAIFDAQPKRFSMNELSKYAGINEEIEKSALYCFAIPVIVSGKPVGSLNLFGPDKYLPLEMDFNFFASIGTYIGMAVKNAQLYKKTNEALEQLQITQDKLIESEKLAGLGALSSNIVHEIGNPLAAITNSVQVLQQRVPLEGRMKELMDIIGWEAERLNRSVEELREFSRPRHLQLKLCDIREVVKKAIFLMNQDFELIWGRKIEKRFPKEMPHIWIDGDAIEQVALNLIKNGLQAVHEGGVVRVIILYRRKAKQPTVRLVVRDNGPGIKSEDLQNIFEPYFSTKARGIGLGMHIVKQIVEAHNGHIHVESKIGIGTTITIEIPQERETDGQHPHR